MSLVCVGGLDDNVYVSSSPGGLTSKCRWRLCPRQVFILRICLKDRPELSSFSREYTVYTRREGIKGCRTLLKNVVYGALRFSQGVSKSTFSKYSLGREGGGHKKEHSVYALDNVDNSGQPLNYVVAFC